MLQGRNSKKYSSLDKRCKVTTAKILLTQPTFSAVKSKQQKLSRSSNGKGCQSRKSKRLLTHPILHSRNSRKDSSYGQRCKVTTAKRTLHTANAALSQQQKGLFTRPTLQGCNSRKDSSHGQRCKVATAKRTLHTASVSTTEISIAYDNCQLAGE